jgi:hypothetical protein
MNFPAISKSGFIQYPDGFNGLIPKKSIFAENSSIKLKVLTYQLDHLQLALLLPHFQIILCLR